MISMKENAYGETDDRRRYDFESGKAAHASTGARDPAVRASRQASDRPGRERLQRERRESQSAPSGHDDAARPLQETPLASGGTDVLSTALAVRQALWRAERAGRQDRGANPAPRRSQRGHGLRRGRNHADSAAAERP